MSPTTTGTLLANLPSITNVGTSTTATQSSNVIVPSVTSTAVVPTRTEAKSTSAGITQTVQSDSKYAVSASAADETGTQAHLDTSKQHADEVKGKISTTQAVPSKISARAVPFQKILEACGKKNCCC